jgi:hypothetical protein
MPARRGQPTNRCTVCGHPERVRIELLLAGGGASHRAIARKYKLSHYAIGRHWNGHVSDERKVSLVFGPVERERLASRVAEESSSVIDHFRAIRSGLYDLYSKALEAGDGSTGALLAGRLHEGLNSIAKITGELANSSLIQNNTMNIFVSPQFAELEAALVRALAPHPQARADVINALRELEARTVQPPPNIERLPALIGQDSHAAG